MYQGLEEQNRLLAEDQYYVAERLQLEEQRKLVEQRIAAKLRVHRGDLVSQDW